MQKDSELHKKDGHLWGLPPIVPSFVIISLTSVIVYKIAITDWNLQFDFPTFLSLLLALFSVGLAAMFYFKATDSSNAFYDNTYKFTQQTAELLVRIESGFGERLRNLDVTYQGMRESFDKLPTKMQIKETREELEEEKRSAEKIVEEREKIISDLTKRAQLNAAESEKVIKELNNKDRALAMAQREMEALQRSLAEAKSNQRNIASMAHRDPRVRRAIISIVLPHLDDVLTSSPRTLIRKFSKIKHEISVGEIRRLSSLGLLDEEGDLTPAGAIAIRMTAKVRKTIDNEDS